METKHSPSKQHVIILGEADFLDKKQSSRKCVYIIDGLYIGSTNDLKRRVREYLGRAKRNDPIRSNTPIMKYIKQRLADGHTIKFFVLHSEPCREFMYINKYTKRGVKLLNVVMQWNYKDAQEYGKSGFYSRLRESNGRLDG